jgi:hypothetical protein
MKKLFITAVIATMFSVAAFSVTAFADGGKKAVKKTGEKNVSYTALNQFKTDFKDAANVVWTVTSNCQKVSFTENNTDYTAFYDFNGEYLGLTHYVAFNVLSESVKKQITKNYKGYIISRVIKFESQEKEQLVYSAQVRTVDSSAIVKAAVNDDVVYFIDLKSVADEVLLQVTPDDSITVLKQD